MWCDKDSKGRRANGPASDGAFSPVLDGLCGLVALQMPDDVGDVGDLLFEIALVLLELAKPFFAARKAAAAAKAVASAHMSVSVHLHLPSS